MCKMQYVGKTENSLHLRMNGHRSDYYRRLPYKPIAKHFYNMPSPTFEDASVRMLRLDLIDGSTEKVTEFTPFGH